MISGKSSKTMIDRDTTHNIAVAAVKTAKKRQRGTTRRRGTAAIVTLAVIAAVGVYIPITLLTPYQNLSMAVAEPLTTHLAAATVKWPKIGSAAFGAVGIPGIVAASGVSTPLPIASISKVITALVVLEQKPLALGEEGPNLTFTAADAALYRSYFAANGKVEPVRVGLVLSEHQVLEAMLVASANNYAESLSTWAFGSTPAYVAATTAWLARHGFSQTTIVEPTGMSPRNVSTTSDLVGIGTLAIAHPVIAAIVATKSLDLPVVGHVTNSNELLGLSGIDGIKTGTLEKAGACLLFSARYVINGSALTVVGVVLGGADHPSLNVDIQAMLLGIAAGFHAVPLSTKEQSFAALGSQWGSKAQAVVTAARTLFVWSDTTISGHVVLTPMTSAQKGQKIGNVTFTAGKSIIELPLTLDRSLADPGIWWRLTHPYELILN